MVAGRDAGGFWFGAGRGGGEPDGRALPGGVVPVFEHAVRGGVARGERGVRVRGAARGVRAHRRGAAGAGARQRHRRGAPGLVGQDRGGGGVPEVRRASPDRGQVLQSGRGQREGQRGERGRVPAPQRDGAVAERRVACAADEVHALQMRSDRRGSPLPQGRAGQGSVRAGSGGDGLDAGDPVRRMPVGGAQGRRRGMCECGLASLSRGPVVARMDARCRSARVRRGDPNP